MQRRPAPPAERLAALQRDVFNACRMRSLAVRPDALEALANLLVDASDAGSELSAALNLAEELLGI